jgi:hypothetical protein
VKGVSDSRFDDLSKQFGREKGEHLGEGMKEGKGRRRVELQRNMRTIAVSLREREAEEEGN